MIARAALAICLLCASAAAAQAAGEAALQHAREGVGSLLRGKYEEAIAAYSAALEAGGLPELRLANIYNDRGVAKWRLKRTRDAIADFNRAVELFPDFAVVYNNRGNALMDLQRPQDALGDFDRAVALAPAYGAAHNNRGNALFALGRHEEALGAFGRAIELMSASAVPHNGRGKAHNALHRPYAALRDLSRAIALDPRYHSAYGNRARAHAALGRWADAVNDYTQALAGDSERADLYVARARAHAAEGRTSPAIQDLTRAIEASPELVEAHVERGRLYARVKEFAKAHADLSHALDLRRDHADAYAHRAWVALQTDMGEEALADVTLALEIEPQNTLALRVRGEVRERLEQVEEAIADHHAALARDPMLEESRAALKRLTGEAPPAQVEVAGPAIDGWSVTRARDGGYVATNPDHPKLRVPLEMYGLGEPRILEWEPRDGAFRGTGLLRYEAGTARDRDGAPLEDAPLEYVAIVDVNRSLVLAIEPFRIGDLAANWEWREASVLVTDAQGVASEIQLRRVAAATPRQAAQPQPARSAPAAQRERHWFYDRDQRPPPRQTRRPSSPSDGGFFDWLLGR